MVAHHDQGGATQQTLARHVLDEIVIRVVALPAVREVVVSETGLPDEGEVELRGELERQFAAVIQQAVERLPRAEAEVSV